MRPALFLFGILAFCLCTGPLQLSAQQMKTPELQENIRELALRDAKAVNLWWWGWLGGYSAATIGQGIAGLSSDKLSFRQDMLLSAATTFVGAAGQFVSAVRPVNLKESGLTDRNSSSMNSSDKESLTYLEKSAANEIKGRKWQIHLMSGAVNLTSGLVTWFGFKRTWKDGLINFGINTVVAEAQIWSQPMKARRFLERKNQGGKVTGGSGIRQNPGYSVNLYSSGNGLCLAIRF